jgi:hypothetical protein
MNPLREHLKSHLPELYAALERSWKVAFDEWLPAVPPNSDSFNSYPHVRNLENYLHKLVVAHERRMPGATLFSVLELYVLLVCILLHDIGKAGDRPKSTESSKRTDEHDKRSEAIIKENWSHLGIPNRSLAHSVARICGVHSARPENLRKELADLSTIVVDPYGQIRERALAAVLILIDHMDTTGLRTVADYLKEGDFSAPDIKPLGAFRKKIRGVDIDLDGGLVKVVLDDDWQLSEGSSSVWIEAIRKEPRRNPPHPLSLEFLKALRKELGVPHDGLCRILSADVAKRAAECLAQPMALGENEMTWLTTDLSDFRISPLRRKPNGRKAVQFVQDRILLAILMRDTRTNHRVLEPISDILTGIDLPLLGWRIEYKERLFEWNGQESFEPVLSLDRIEGTLRKAWSLSTEIFAAGKLAYSTLAAELGQPCPRRVRMALNRLNLIASAELNGSGPFGLSDTEWYWLPHSSSLGASANNTRPLHCVGFPRCRNTGGQGDCEQVCCGHRASVGAYKTLLSRLGRESVARKGKHT